MADVCVPTVTIASRQGNPNIRPAHRFLAGRVSRVGTPRRGSNPPLPIRRLSPRLRATPARTCVSNRIVVIADFSGGLTRASIEPARGPHSRCKVDNGPVVGGPSENGTRRLDALTEFISSISAVRANERDGTWELSAPS